MTNQRSLVAVAATMLMLSSIGAAAAEESPAPPPEAAPARVERKHSVNLGLGVLVGATSLTYEYKWTRHRGLVLELNHLHLPTNEKHRPVVGGLIGLALQTSGVISKGDRANTGLGVAIGHRWHWRKGQRTGFYGLHAGFDLARSHDYVEGSILEHGMFYLMANTGQQWRLGDDVQFTARFGVGLALRLEGDEYERERSLSVRPLDELIDRFPLTLDAELSVGYLF